MLPRLSLENVKDGNSVNAVSPAKLCLAERRPPDGNHICFDKLGAARCSASWLTPLYDFVRHVFRARPFTQMMGINAGGIVTRMEQTIGWPFSVVKKPRNAVRSSQIVRAIHRKYAVAKTRFGGCPEPTFHVARASHLGPKTHPPIYPGIARLRRITAGFGAIQRVRASLEFRSKFAAAIDAIRQHYHGEIVA